MLPGNEHSSCLVSRFSSDRQWHSPVWWFRVSSHSCTLQAITRLQHQSGVFSHAVCHWNSYETPHFQYCNHVIDRSVQCAIGTRSPKTTPHDHWPLCPPHRLTQQPLATHWPSCPPSLPDPAAPGDHWPLCPSSPPDPAAPGDHWPLCPPHRLTQQPW